MLEEVASDRQANWMARTGAIDAMKQVGAEKAKFEKLQKGYADAKGKDKLVFDKVERVLKKLGETK